MVNLWNNVASDSYMGRDDKKRYCPYLASNLALIIAVWEVCVCVL